MEATLSRNISFNLASLISQIELGQIGPPWPPATLRLAEQEGSRSLRLNVPWVPCGLSSALAERRLRSRASLRPEQRNLLYVARTRARERLIITCSGKGSHYLDNKAIAGSH